MEDINVLAQFAQQLAHDAGLLLRQAYAEQPLTNSAKRESPKSMHLAEDKTMDTYLVERILKQYPNHAVTIEESGQHGIETAKVRWLVDPIDGSSNFANHNPFIAISLAVLVDDVVTVGVIEAPILGEQFVAIRGQGAFLNGESIRVSGTTELNQAYVVSCDGGMEDRTQVFSTLVRNYYDQVKDFRKLGSAALECAWVACGRADGYATMEIDPWDVAAGVLLINEAGGKTATFSGDAWLPKQSDLLASNGHIHQAMTDRLWGY